MIPRQPAQHTDQKNNPKALRALSRVTLLAVGTAIVLLAFSVITPTTSHAKKGGGSPNDPTPATIVFNDVFDDDIQSDNGTPYVDIGDPNLEVIVGSQGSFFLRPHESGRQINLNLPANSCGLNGEDYDFQFLIVDVESVVNGGAFGMDENGGDTFAPMRIRFFDDGGQPYFLYFNPDASGPCRNESQQVFVQRTSATEWTVSASSTGACLEKARAQEFGTKKPEQCTWTNPGEGPMDFSFDLTTP